MVKKIFLLILLINSFVPFTYTQEETIAELISSNKENNETAPYDHLDYLADHEPVEVVKPHPLPHWLKSFLFGAFIRFFNTVEFFKKSWKKIQLNYKK